MPNHIHLILESPLGASAMSRFMHGVDMSYAMTFNNKYSEVGHLWQGRFKNSAVLKDEYLINLINYVEYNPVRAGLVTEPAQYAWSSYRARVFGSTDMLYDSLDRKGTLLMQKK